MSKGKENAGTAQAGVLTYLEQQNRPYSAVDIFNNLHKEYGKTLVVKTLEQLAEKGSIKEKNYGKQKVYVFNQDNVPTAAREELAAMDSEAEKLVRLNEQLQTEVNHLTSQHKKLVSNLTLKDAKAKLKDVDEECKVMTEKLVKLRDGQVLISKEEKDKIYASRTSMVKAWRKRKRMATDILDAILEGYPKPKKTLFEDIGIETDEEYQLTIPKD
ncbi:homologous-pairing protein 2 homolog [Watersipora subatra]|uniref:homologous-pairing protein 2 homolog n=1 Tax=Watersipora subatra TaxID=2589382 RepID=UPI00355C44B2